MTSKSSFSTPEKLSGFENFDCQVILDNVPIGVFCSTYDGRYIYVNNALADMYGYKNPQEMIQEISDIPTQIYVDPKDRKNFLQMLEEHDEIVNNECKLMRKDGKQIWVSSNVRTVRDSSGKIIFYHGFSQDISHQKLSDQRLQKQIRLLNGFLDNAPDIMSIKKSDLSLIRYNKAGYDFLRISPEEAHGRKCYELLNKKSPCPNCASLDAIKSGKPVHREKYVPEIDTYFDCRANPVISDDGQNIYIVELIRDITEKKKAEQEISRVNRELEQTLSEKDNFLSILAHDLRSPISGLKSMTSILSKSMEMLSRDELLKMAEIMKNSAENIYDLLDNLLNWSMLQRGVLSYEQEQIHLDQIVDQNIRLFYDQAVAKDIEITSEVKADIKVFADVNMIRLILRNLISNAVKFTHEGG
ncbi:MAG: PAS domain-containing protein, partial [Desulfonatronovibrio sp.]